ncbi:MAG TPA: phosphoribosylaminoimidazolesuccinocarboxamide synthase, partial [Flammeovirgaceae bacterium]|nr:phosphoribosylaminoimidazolesuccinocarboxamide synthase [Flammeovirgaceae bacterium]
MEAVKETHFDFPGQTGFYRGKVRDVYYFGNLMAMVVTDRISAFDVILPCAIPYKGQVLNRIAARNLEATRDIVDNWLLATPDPQVAVGYRCQPFAVEMVIRGYLAGHAWREYRAGKRSLCGVPLPDGLKENDPLPEPIITPSTKAREGHDEDISRKEILQQGLVPQTYYVQMEDITRRLFARGSQLADKRGLILVDTKYEFGLKDGKIVLIDEIHTPDSSRYFYRDGYAERQAAGQPQRQLSKEFVRQWLIENGFQGRDGEQVPAMTDEVVQRISERYLELYRTFTGETLKSENSVNLTDKIYQNLHNWLQQNKELWQ